MSRERGRVLGTDDDVWAHNTWDDAPWTPEREAAAVEVVAAQERQSTATPECLQRLAESAQQNWDKFYRQHEQWFFRDRNWLPAEFPELFAVTGQERVVLELGCGAGNTLFPLLKEARARQLPLRLLGCDISGRAVELVRKGRDFDGAAMRVFQHDLASDEPLDVPPGSVDVALAIFVLSAVPPARLAHVFGKIGAALKPGGVLLFRDYGQFDMAQLRFKACRRLAEDTYARGDGTLAHFFTEKELGTRASAAGLELIECRTDRRLVVNRFRRLTMFRVWLQARLVRPHE